MVCVAVALVVHGNNVHQHSIASACIQSVEAYSYCWEHSSAKKNCTVLSTTWLTTEITHMEKSDSLSIHRQLWVITKTLQLHLVIPSLVIVYYYRCKSLHANHFSTTKRVYSENCQKKFISIGTHRTDRKSIVAK